ncbi:tripeptidyl peptidase a [Moniliophthora roreri MCA 2997]|uniref:tripeptidyl-peptidase II n=1 Tax=Moniliophthora roreri (strain MCA 2997) TaxID=1381753 RepID=V2X6J0_MONRO|nr:tripeptidyl peptidase a [Moniliophthora roreri MCA 2997]
MRLFSVVFLSFGLALSQAKPHVKRWDDFVEKHSWASTPKGWEFHSLPRPDSLIDLKLGLKSARIDELATHLMQTSDPAHPRYGQHLSKEEVEALVAPHADSTAAVEEWLEFYSAKGETSTSGEWITIRLPVADAERMLNAKYGLYHHDKSKDTVLRTLSYSLPRELMAHVDVVSPTTYFGTLKSMRTTSFLQPELDVAIEKGTINFGADIEPGSDATVPASCGTTITPSCLKGLYNTTNYTPRAASQNSLGVAGYLDEFANHADLRTFLARFLPSASDQAGSDFTTIRVNNGGDDQNDPGVEANLDIQYTIAMSFPTPNTYYSTGGSPPFNPDSQTPTNTNEPYLDWLNFILDQTSIPLVFTTSYGDDEQTVPQDYANKVCDLFMRLGARGSSVLFSSGDFGVGGGDCATNDGTNRRLFQPAFPASCPWVTAVGGTTRVNPEVAVNFSGGGFSRYFAQPSYQSTAVNSFLSAIGTTNQGLFNATGRAYPDVAAQGTGFQVVIGGRTGSVGGTSASCPTVAGIIALLNDFRLSNGKSSLGFLNPLIYANPTAFNDITSGNNPGCGTNGFSARAGWDPVTGFGTPDFVKLQALV